MKVSSGRRISISSFSGRGSLMKMLLPNRSVSSLIVLFVLLLTWNNNLLGFIHLPDISRNIVSSSTGNSGSGPYFHLLIPATSPNVKLCKTLLTSLVHNYPTPTFINWGRSYTYEDLHGYDPITGKIWGVLQFLLSLPTSRDNDLVMMIDGHDVWFQLRPEVLIERYHHVNKEANARLAKQFGKDTVRDFNISQTIVFGAEKYCWPQDHNSAHCYASPESPLPQDIYGGNTDHGFKNNRPRWLNSGTIMGPVGDMRKLFEHVHQRWLREPNNLGMDQYYFGEVFGLQEYERHKIRNSTDWVHSFEWFEPEDVVIPLPQPDGQSEFHIGLDYNSTMFQTLNVAQNDLEFVRYNGQDDLYELQNRMRVTRPGKLGIPEDIAKSRPPILPAASKNGNNEMLTGLPVSTLTHAQWKDTPLCTNFRAGSIPVSVHHNGDKSGIDWMWKKLWFVPAAKEALLRSAFAPDGPVAVGNKRNGGRSFWSMREGKRGGWSDTGDWLPWENICSTFEQDIFVN